MLPLIASTLPKGTSAAFSSAPGLSPSFPRFSTDYLHGDDDPRPRSASRSIAWTSTSCAEQRRDHITRGVRAREAPDIPLHGGEPGRVVEESIDLVRVSRDGP